MTKLSLRPILPQPVSWLGGIVLSLSMLIASFASAQMDVPVGSNTIGALPARFELEAIPGQILNETTNIFVQNNRRLSIEPELLDWGLNQQGSVFFVDANTLSGSASSWVSFDLNMFELARDQQRSIPFTISVPDNTPSGVYRTALTFAIEPLEEDGMPLQDQQVRVNIRRRVAVIVYVTVGSVTTDSRVSDAFLENGGTRPESVFVVNNVGTSLLRLNGHIEYIGTDGRVIHRDAISERVVLPEGLSEFRRPLPDDLPSRAVLATLNLTDSRSGIELYGEIPLP